MTAEALLKTNHQISLAINRSAITRGLFLVLILLLYKPVSGQDSTGISYTQEADTLVRQRFIDQYEEVFMTRIPTRHMFKFGSGIYPGNTSKFSPNRIGILTAEIGYEYKLLPAFSIGVNLLSSPKVDYDPQSSKIYAVNLQGRWYYDMKKRIWEGKSANNFSGNFVAGSYGKSWRYAPQSYPMTRLGVEYGIQRRLLNDGRIEFAIGIFYQKYASRYFVDNMPFASEKVNDFAIITRTSIGGVFGDWKRTHHGPLCEVLHCNEEISQQWKILWPTVYIGTRAVTGAVAFAYERKIGRSPFSVNAQVFADYRKMDVAGTFNGLRYEDRSYQVQPSLHIRYYFLQKLGIRRGWGGNNLSGLYAGPYTDYINFSSKLGFTQKTYAHFGVGLSGGYQKKLFRRAYFDFQASWSHNVLKNQPVSADDVGSVRIGFGWAL